MAVAGYVALPIELQKYQYYMAAGFPQNEWYQRKTKVEAAMTLPSARDIILLSLEDSR